MTKVIDYGPVSDTNTQLKEAARNEFKDQIFQLTKKGIRVEVERDAKQWPVSVTFRKSLPGAKLQIHVTREHGESKFGVTQNDDGLIVDMYRVVQGGIAYEFAENEVCGKYFSHQIYVPDEKLDEVKSIIFNIDKTPKTQFGNALDLLIPEIVGLMHKNSQGIFVTEDPYYTDKGKQGLEILKGELLEMFRTTGDLALEMKSG